MLAKHGIKRGPTAKRLEIERVVERSAAQEVPQVVMRLTPAQAQVIGLDQPQVRAIYGVEQTYDTKRGVVLRLTRTGAGRMLKHYKAVYGAHPSADQPLHWYQLARTAAKHIERVLTGEERVALPDTLEKVMDDIREYVMESKDPVLVRLVSRLEAFRPVE